MDYIAVCVMSGSTIYFHLINITFFRRKYLNTQCVLLFSLQLLSQVAVILRIIRRDIIIKVLSYSIKYPLFFQILMKIKFSRHIFEKYPNIKFHEDLSSRTRVIQCGRRTGRHNEANSRSSQLFKRA